MASLLQDPPYASKLASRLAWFSGQETAADVHFTLADGSVVPAHSLVLAAASPVWMAQLYGPMKPEPGKAIDVRDIDSDVFRGLLNYCYTEYIDVVEENALPLLYAARKYQMESVEKECLEFLEDNVSKDNALPLLDAALLYDAKQLKIQCLATISAYTAGVLLSPEIETLSLDALTLVLQQDTLDASEGALVWSARRWARAECNRQGLQLDASVERELLGSAFYFLRFPAMTPAEFAEFAEGPPGFLTQEEVTLGVVNADNGECLGSINWGLRSDGGRGTHDVLLEDSVQMDPGCSYRIEVKVTGPSTYCGSVGLRNVSGANNVLFTFTSNDDERSTSDRVETGYNDSYPHYVDIEALRDMSIKAYMEGGHYDDLHEWGVTEEVMSYSLCAAIFFTSLIMMCCCNTCQKHLMRDFYQLEYKARKDAELRALEKQRQLENEIAWAQPMDQASEYRSRTPSIGEGPSTSGVI